MSVKLNSKWQDKNNPRKIATAVDVDPTNKTYPIRLAVSWGDIDSSGFSDCGESYRCAESYVYCMFNPIE